MSGTLDRRTFPTAASPRRTSLTLLLGLGAAAAAESDITVGCKGLEYVLFFCFFDEVQSGCVIEIR